MGGSGAAPLRYGFTSRSLFTFSPWIDSTYTYSISQIGLANNPLANVEVVSSLNAFNLGHYTYHYYSKNCIKKYNPKVYIGTAQTLGREWIIDQQTGIKYPENWPLSSSQKGEANTKIFNIFYKCFLHLSLFSNTKDKFTFQSLIAINIGL